MKLIINKISFGNIKIFDKFVNNFDLKIDDIITLENKKYKVLDLIRTVSLNYDHIEVSRIEIFVDEIILDKRTLPI